MLTALQARAIAAEWRPQFGDEASFETSWRRFFEMVGDPSPARLEAWLAKDQTKEGALQAGLSPEPLVPMPSRYRRTECDHCGGNGYVHADVPIADSRFGKAVRCPDCNGGLRSETVTATTNGHQERTGAWCWRCGADQAQPAQDGCIFPSWHGLAVPSGATVATVLKRIA